VPLLWYQKDPTPFTGCRSELEELAEYGDRNNIKADLGTSVIWGYAKDGGGFLLCPDRVDDSVTEPYARR
jgi:hypothetical protein